MPAAATPPEAADHDAPVGARTPAAARVESLGHAAELRAPGQVLVKSFLGLLGDADPLTACLLAEAGDAAGRRAFLLLGCRPDLELRQRPEDHDLVILDCDLNSCEPAVREPAGKPTFDRSELFFIHNYKITLQQACCQALPPRLPGRWREAPVGGIELCSTPLSCF